MDRDVFAGKLNRILALRGDVAHGVGAQEWTGALDSINHPLVMRAAIAVVRELLVPDWADRRQSDKRPQLALEAAEAWLAEPTEDAAKNAKAAAKACTAARNETFGYEHRVPEAARGIAWAAGGREASSLFDALECAETELLSRIALTAEYHRGPEQRRAIVDVLRRVLMPPEEKAPEPTTSAADRPPVPYSPDGHFELGQRLVHKKFGDIAVSAVGETWIEVAIPDGTKKRLAHKP